MPKDNFRLNEASSLFVFPQSPRFQRKLSIEKDKNAHYFPHHGLIVHAYDGEINNTDDCCVDSEQICCPFDKRQREKRNVCTRAAFVLRYLLFLNSKDEEFKATNAVLTEWINSRAVWGKKANINVRIFVKWIGPVSEVALDSPVQYSRPLVLPFSNMDQEISWSGHLWSSFFWKQCRLGVMVGQVCSILCVFLSGNTLHPLVCCLCPCSWQLHLLTRLPLTRLFSSWSRCFWSFVFQPFSTAAFFVTFSIQGLYILWTQTPSLTAFLGPVWYLAITLWSTDSANMTNTLY